MQNNNELKVIVEKLHPDAKIPTKGSAEAACFDIYSVENAVVQQGLVTIVRTGVKMRIPTGYMIHIVPRSGLAYHHGVAVLGGIVDSDYRGEIMVMLSALDSGTYKTIEVGERIAQLQIIPVPPVSMVEGSVDNDTERGEGGFGSTGS